LLSLFKGLGQVNAARRLKNIKTVKNIKTIKTMTDEK